MKVDCIHYKETNYFSKIVIDYLEGAPTLTPFYQYQPEISSFQKAIENKNFSLEKREVLAHALAEQYAKGGIHLKESLVAQNIESLKTKNTFTITTGHQLNLFTGPLYFIYKIVSVINLSKRLKKLHPEQNFVPVYWMATEDHDFEEISFFRFKGKTLQWETQQKGAVGRMNPKELIEVFEEFKTLITPYSTNEQQLKEWFEKAYLQHDNLADATRYLVHEMFYEHGLLIVDGDDPVLKTMFIPQVKEELQKEISAQLVAQQNERLAEHYKIQVNPRAINLFYLIDGSRERIIKGKSGFSIHNTQEKFSTEEFYNLLEKHPERFSPNVLLRPLYQEVILPNLAYIGGGGELAYWFQLKTTFEHFNLPLPVLLLRNSALWLDAKAEKYKEELKLSTADLFVEEGVLLKNWVKSNSKIDLTLKDEIKQQQDFFQTLSEKAGRVDATLKPHTLAMAEKQKQLLEQLSEKLIRSERLKNTTAADRIAYLKKTFFPKESLQERTDNFSLLYLVYGKNLIPQLMDNFELPTKQFVVLSEK